MLRKIQEDWIVFRKDHTKPPFLKSYVYMIDESESDDDDLNEGKREVIGSVFYRHSQPSNDLQKDLFGKKAFPNPKDHEVLAKLIRYVTKGDPHAVILDSFAGSASTGHAVAKLNSEDYGQRRFILVEMEQEVAANLAAKRLRLVIEGYRTAKGPEVAGLGGGFRYCTLVPPMFDAQGNIRDGVTFADLAAHVYFTETGEPIPKRAARSLLLGVHNGRAVYLLFNGILGDKRPDGGNVLTGVTLAALPKHSGPRMVYGDGCRLSPQRLKREGVTFKQIPYGIKVT